jgi:hypothetical protein
MKGTANVICEQKIRRADQIPQKGCKIEYSSERLTCQFFYNFYLFLFSPHLFFPACAALPNQPPAARPPDAGHTPTLRTCIRGYKYVGFFPTVRKCLVFFHPLAALAIISFLVVSNVFDANSYIYLLKKLGSITPALASIDGHNLFFLIKLKSWVTCFNHIKSENMEWICISMLS